MQFSHKIKINTTPQIIFKIYADVENWSTWDKSVESSSIDGTFQTGAIGKLKPIDAPQSKIEFVSVINNKSFTTLGKLPLCKMYFEHDINVLEENLVEVVHTVKFIGLLAPLFGRIIGKGIDSSLPDVLQALKVEAETH